MTGASMIALLAAVWTFCLLMALVTALRRRVRKQRLLQNSPERFRPKRVRLIRPCAGDEPGLFDALVSLRQAGRHFEVDVVMGVDRPDDSAVPAIDRAVAALERDGISARRIVATGTGPNRKVVILAACAAAAGAPVDAVISADSDVNLAGVDLDALVAHLIGDVGAAWAPFVETSGDHRALGNRAAEAVLCRSFHAFSLLNVLDPNGMVGKLFAVTANALGAMGGFASLVSYLGEDMAMQQRLKEAGFETVGLLTPVVITKVGPRTFTGTVRRHARWMTVIKAQRPPMMLTYPLFFFNTLFILPMAAAVIGSIPTAALAIALFAIVTRGLVARVAERLLGQESTLFHRLADAFIGDVVLLLAFLTAIWSRRLTWRGRRFSIDADGRLVSLTD